MESSKLKKVLGILLAFSGLLFIYSIFGRSINVDDAWLGETAMWLAKDGVIRSEALRGWENAEQHVFFTHKLLIFEGALFVKIFGYSVYSLKAVSAVFLGLLLASWVWFFKKRNLPTVILLTFSTLVLVNSFIFEYGFIYRPELALALFASWVYFLLQDEQTRHPWRWIVFAGLFAGLAIGHHLNGVVIAGAGCVLLISQKRYLQFFVFGCVATGGFLFHLLDVRSVTDFNLMVAQFANTQDMRGTRGALDYIFRIIDEQRRYLHSPREASVTFLFGTCVFIGFSYLKSRYKDLLIFIAGMMFFLALVSHGKTSKYLILQMPLMLFLISIVLYEFGAQCRKTFAVFVALYFVFQMQNNWQNSYYKGHERQLYEGLAGSLPAGSKILAPMEAAFWSWDRYRMQATEVYDIYQFSGDTADGQRKILEKIGSAEIEALILSDRIKSMFGINGSAFGPFKSAGRNEDARVELFLLDKSAQ